MDITHPKPFNPSAKSGDFKSGDKVIRRDGSWGTVLGPQDFDGYDYNKPSPKWELVEWYDPHNLLPDMAKRTWVGNLWIKHQT